jgi:hypothetical protein
LALIWKDGLKYNFPTSLHQDFENFITFKKTDWDILGGGCVASSEENDVWLSDNVDFFSASYPEPRQEADGCHMTPKREKKRSPRLLAGKVQSYTKYRKENYYFGM